MAVLCLTPSWSSSKKPKTTEVQVPELLLPEGRKLTFERSLQTDRDVRPKPGFFTKVFDLVVGKPDLHFLVRPYSVVEDSRGRIIVTDPGAQGVHIFDPVQQKYKFIERKDKSKDAMLAPQCVAVDDKDNIYVTDSESGKIFVFNSDGKFQHALGSLKGGEGFFKRPTGIAVDSDEQRIYVTDTLRNKIFVTRHERQCPADHRENWRRRRRVQLSHRATARRQGSAGGRCHEFPRAGHRPLRPVPLTA